MAHHEPVWGGLGWWEPVPQEWPSQGALSAEGHLRAWERSFFLFLLGDALAGFELVCLERVPGLQLGGCLGETGQARATLIIPPHLQSCWNCGRKASETCSGCNAARYCGSFCQHKDWEKHHHVCGQSLQGPAAAVAEPVPGQSDTATGLGPCLPPAAASPSEAGSTGPSRPGSPGPPGPLDAAPR